MLARATQLISGHWDFADEFGRREKDCRLSVRNIATTLTAGGAGDWMQLHVDKSNHKSLCFCTRQIWQFVQAKKS